MLLSVLPLSVGLPVIDHLLLRWVIDVGDLHAVLLRRFLLCPPCLLVMTQTVLEVLPDVHPLPLGRSCAVPWSELLWQESSHLFCPFPDLLLLLLRCERPLLRFTSRAQCWQYALVDVPGRFPIPAVVAFPPHVSVAHAVLWTDHELCQLLTVKGTFLLFFVVLSTISDLFASLPWPSPS